MCTCTEQLICGECMMLPTNLRLKEKQEEEIIYLKGADKKLYCLSHKGQCPTPAIYVNTSPHIYDLARNDLKDDKIGCVICELFIDNSRIYDKGLIAWRGWSLQNIPQSCPDEFKYRLVSISFPVIWEPRKKLIAENKNKQETSGIWAVKREHFDNFTGSLYNYQFDVIGEVYLWGKIIEHELGYRAEFAYPKSLFIIGGMNNIYKVMDNLEDYGVDVRIISQFERPWGGLLNKTENKYANR